jgi:hypothetical protein
MKNFSKFLEEITIKGNTGIPGEENKSEPGYISSVNRKGAEKVGHGDPRRIGGEMMQLIGRSNNISRGKEKELEEFAERIIRSVYSGILDNVNLDIKMLRSGTEIAEFIGDENERKEEERKEEQEKEKEQEKEEKNPEQPKKPENRKEEEGPKKSTNKELKLEVDKRKLANNIIQGEAKNTKFIIEMPDCKDGLKRILGDRQGEEYHRIIIEISKLADKMDWIIPIDVKADMMEMAPEGMAGAVSIEWPEAESPETKKSAEEILKEIEEGSGEEEEGEDPLEKNREEIEELFSNGNPIIKARGIDFPMLLHETVKGIYELIASAGIPKDKTIATNVLFNTSSFADEAEDFRYGPYIAADLRDFINKNSKADKYPNMREYVFGKLIDLPAEQFLISIKNILMNAPEARKQIDDIIDGIITELGDYEEKLTGYESNKKLSEYEEESPEEAEEEETPKEDAELKKISNQGVDYSKMRKADLQSEIDAALDSGDYEKVKMLSQYLKEGKEIYLREIERINETSKHHNRRK